MRAAYKSASFRKKVGIPKEVAREFYEADKSKEAARTRKRKRNRK